MGKCRGKYFAQIDDDDYEWINKYNWHLAKSKTSAYPATYIRSQNGVYQKIFMHRMILKTNEGLFIDHIDRNGLNCQRNNLRICTRTENNRNRCASGASKYLGVSIKQYTKKGRHYIYWVATVKENGKNKQLGHFKKQEDAAIAYNEAAKNIYGEFANLNVITPLADSVEQVVEVALPPSA